MFMWLLLFFRTENRIGGYRLSNSENAVEDQSNPIGTSRDEQSFLRRQFLIKG